MIIVYKLFLFSEEIALKGSDNDTNSQKSHVCIVLVIAFCQCVPASFCNFTRCAIDL